MSNSTIPVTSSPPPSSTPQQSSIFSSNPPSSAPPSSSIAGPSSTPGASQTSTAIASSAPPSTTQIQTSVFTTTRPDGSPSVVTEVRTVTQSNSNPSQATTAPGGASSPSSSSTSPAALQSQSGAAGSGLSPGGKTAIAVVIPVVVVGLLVLGGIFLWRKRKQRKNAEEARRKEVEEYGFNPNNDPTLPAVGGVAGSQMTEDSSGYRGWGNATTTSNRKTSTTVSGGMAGISDSGSQPGGYHSPSSPTQNGSDGGQSHDPLMSQARRETMDSDNVGALGQAPAAGANRGDIHRGPSNASSSYSAGNRSDGSDNYNGNGQNNYYEDQYYQGPGSYEGYGGQNAQPIIRDVSARRNTRIENPSVFPQQGNSGIAQNF